MTITIRNRDNNLNNRFVNKLDNKPDNNQLVKVIFGILFVSEQGVCLAELCATTGESEEAVGAAIGQLKAYLSDDKSALCLREVAAGYKLFTRPELHEVLEEYIVSKDKRKLSASAIETLAIVAYSQPVTRAQVSQVRGVNSDALMTTLVNKGFIFENGVSEAPGNPGLFSTTEKFLDSFGIRSLDELSPLEDFAPDEEARLAIAERLGAIHSLNAEGESQEMPLKE